MAFACIYKSDIVGCKSEDTVICDGEATEDLDYICREGELAPCNGESLLPSKFYISISGCQNGDSVICDGELPEPGNLELMCKQGQIVPCNGELVFIWYSSYILRL